MFVIAGVSGHTGAVVADTLLGQGKKVRVIVRDAAKGEPWKKRGAEVAVTDLADVKGLTQALTGAQGAYLLSPPNFAAPDFLADRAALLANMVKAVKSSGLKNLVFLSSIGAQHAKDTGPIVTAHRAEQAFAKQLPSVTFIRAAYFLENWASVIGLAKGQGVLPHYGPIDFKFPQVCAKDIGLAAAKALLEPGDGTRVVELAGAADWSVADVAAALSMLVGRPVNAISAPVEGAKSGLLQAGIPEPMAHLYAEMYSAAVKGLVAWQNPSTVTRGTTPLIEALRPLV